MSVTRLARTLAYNRRRAAETTGARRAGYLAAAAATAEALHAAEQCEDCGAPLRDPVSIARRRGPDCYAKRRSA